MDLFIVAVVALLVGYAVGSHKKKGGSGGSVGPSYPKDPQ